MNERGGGQAGPGGGLMGRAFRGVGGVIPERTPDQRLQDRRDARILVPVLGVGVAVVAIATYAASGSGLITVLAAIVGYVVLMPVVMIVLMRR